MLTVSNALKAQVIALVNAVFGILDAFTIGHLTDTQKSAIVVGVNAVMAIIVGITYKQSTKRVADTQSPVA